jgi:hypothetical protein
MKNEGKVMKDSNQAPNKPMAVLLTAIYLSSLGLGALETTRAFALTDNTLNPNSVDTTKLKKQAVNADELCDALVADVEKNSDRNNKGNDWGRRDLRDGSTIGTSGQVGWNGKDDQWCANHGLVTDPNVTASSAAPGSGSASGKSCNVPLLAGDTDCKKTSDNMFRCQMHGSQLVPQCLALKAVGNARNKQYGMLAMDIAAVASCTTACFANKTGIGAAADVACQGVGVAASVAEIIANISMSSGPVASAIGALSGVGGAAGVGYSLANAGEKGGFGVGDSAGKGTATLDKSQGAADQKQRRASCAAAAFFVVMTAARTASMSQYDNHLTEKAREAVQKLASQAMAASAGANGQGAGNSSYTFPGGSSGGSASGATGGSTGSANGSNNTADADPFCNATAGCKSNLNPTQGVSATDANVLTQSGLDREISGDAGKLADALRAGVSPHQALSSALGGAGQGSAAMGNLATAAMESGAALASALGLGNAPAETGSAYAGGGGGAGAGHSGAAGGGDNPFANLFGAKDGGGMGGREPAAIQFSGGGRNDDIWHTGTTLNLFEIVSQRVTQVSRRLK